MSNRSCKRRTGAVSFASLVIEEERVVKAEFEVLSINNCREICSHILTEIWKSTGASSYKQQAHSFNSGKHHVQMWAQGYLLKTLWFDPFLR